MAAVHKEKSVKPQLTSLHGDLDLHIGAALLDNKYRHFRRPYVTVVVLQDTVASTRVLKRTRKPCWSQNFMIPLAHSVVDITFQVKDDKIVGTKLIGTVKIPASQIAAGDLISDWFPIMNGKGKPLCRGAEIELRMKFTACEDNPLYREGIAGDPQQRGVRWTYFSLRKDCHVTLYQDAHVKPGQLLSEHYNANSCWEDICHSILEAKHLVYIIGWSLSCMIKLIREPTRELSRGGDLTLGELLKYKSEEGVRILLLLWKDKTSHDKFGIKTGGVMKTHDKEMRKFFKYSSVKCVLASRNASCYASNNLGLFEKQVVGTMFSHHQKCVLVDTQAFGNDRKITSFIGGIDLCDGRYDTPEHRLFRDLNTVFEGDFYNPTYPATVRPPRQPWHDLHCRIDGSAALDVLKNFEQRWRKSAKVEKFNVKFNKVSHCYEDFLIKIERISAILSPELSSTREGATIVPTENWHVQIFRSIDSRSVKGFPKFINISEIEKQNLLCAKNLVIEKSIQAAYIQAIRSAQHYIYIENQYFIGSSYAWPSYKNAGANNLIPMELALKIASKIRANERFAVYVIIPMWPEGDPNSKTVQQILFWQRETMQMMYSIVAQELKSRQMNSHPQDYLNFYCLGKREEPLKDASNANNATVCKSRKNRRFMIYVHSKGMIVDDEYVIVGSANINERSLAGTRDTEIAMGAYQPHHRWANGEHPRGQVYEYRKSLWAEHLGVGELNSEPESSDCVDTVNQIAKNNWKCFTATDFTPLHGHLLKYPLQIDANGKVEPLEGHENFPDVGGSVIGVPTVLLPDVLTT